MAKIQPDKRVNDIKRTAFRNRRAVPGGQQEIQRLWGEQRKAQRKKRVVKTLTHRAKRAVKKGLANAKKK